MGQQPKQPKQRSRGREQETPVLPRLRAVLEILPRSELKGLAEAAGLDGRKVASAEVLEGLGPARLRELLATLPRAVLKDACRALGLDDSGREKAVIVERLVPLDGAAAAPKAATPSAPPPARPSTSKLTQADLERHLWSAADILRGSIDSSDYKNFIFGLLFLKRLSNRFDEECAAVRAAGGNQIWAGRVRYDGFVSNGPFLVSTSEYDFVPCASSPLYGSERTMIVWQRNYPPDWDIIGTVFDGSTAIYSANLSALANNGFQGQSQQVPTVDSDGLHFSVAYSERYSTSATDWDIYVDDFYMSGDTLRVAQTHQNLAYTTAFEFNPRIASKNGSGGPTKRYLVAWSKELSSSNHDIHGGLFDGYAGGTATLYCAGDGAPVSCPCGNIAAIGHGCASSVNAAGALLTMTGAPSTLEDTSVLRVEGVPAMSACLFFQGDAFGFPLHFGDGVRCVAGTVIRIGTKTASAGVASYPEAGDPTIAGAGGVPINGGTRFHQVWYRNSAAFCTAATFNLSNGVQVYWSRSSIVARECERRACASPARGWTSWTTLAAAGMQHDPESGGSRPDSVSSGQ